jgi:hypothetical protein
MARGRKKPDLEWRYVVMGYCVFGATNRLAVSGQSFSGRRERAYEKTSSLCQYAAGFSKAARFRIWILPTRCRRHQ